MERSKKTPTPTRAKKAKKAARAPQLRRLATADLRRLAKPHTGFEAFLEPLIELMQQFGDQVGSNIVDVAGMRASLAAWQELAPAHDAAVQQLALVDNTRVVESSSVWTQMLVIYSHAKIAARTNADIRAMLQPFEQFMKTGPRDKSKTPTTAAT